ncbi:MAG: ATPase [Bacteroidota bacterium]
MTNLCKRQNGKNVYTAEDCFRFLEERGQHHYGAHFRIYPEDHKLIFRLLVYFIQDLHTAKELNLNLRKGILLTGPIGCGKTSLMFLMRYFLPDYRQYTIKSTRTISLEFQQNGHEIIQRYSNQSFHYQCGELHPKALCFDDLVVEQPLKHYGNQCNIMAEILLSRYDLFIHRHMLTHLTTNLSASEIEQAYGNRVRSRMREMFNLLAFDREAKDKRV